MVMSVVARQGHLSLGYGDAAATGYRGQLADFARIGDKTIDIPDRSSQLNGAADLRIIQNLGVVLTREVDRFRE